MAEPTPSDNSTPEHIEQLLDKLESIETKLVDLTECLQKEREYVTLFDISNLLEVIDRKHQLLETIDEESEKRQQIFYRAWTSAGGDREDIPEKVPEMLRGLADLEEDHADRLEGLASRFEALMDVIWELREVNESLIHRSLHWLNAYVDDISAHVSSSTYDSSGEMKEASFNILRGMV